ncbi:flagellar export protein FliJ [Desulfobacterota bacterium M19]
MAYRYKLETLLNVRRNVEEQAQLKLAHELYVLENHKAYLIDLQAKRLEALEALSRYKRGTMAAAMYSFYVENIERKDREIIFQYQAIAAQEQAVAVVRDELVARMKERQIVERLKEKDFKLYRQEELRREQKESDEQAVLRFR